MLDLKLLFGKYLTAELIQGRLSVGLALNVNTLLRSYLTLFLIGMMMPKAIIGWVGWIKNTSIFIFFLSSTLVVHAQEIPAPVDQAYPGTIVLDVDATNFEQKIFTIHEQIPVKEGKLTLLFPNWLPGRHSPTGPLTLLAGLKVTAADKPLEWKRDTINMFAFHLDIPTGVQVIKADYQYLSPVESNEGRITVTPEMIGVQWNAMLLYPAGYYARGIQFQPNLLLPKEWKYASALELERQEGAQVRFKSVNLDDLVDSPLFAGKYFQRLDLDPGAKLPVFLNVVADRPENLQVKPEQLALHRAMVQQAYKLFESQHYTHYDFLLALSDQFSGIGLEHHQSSENGVLPHYFTDWNKSWGSHGLLPHEFTHSWDGKFRRPADLWTPNFDVPMQDSLLWVYEGQTTYWGEVLAARSGLESPEQIRASLATIAATYDQRSGRAWRSLQDTTNMPVISRRGPLGWVSWQRAEDYYREGLLVWLDVDTKIRELSGEKRSLNDFARAFFGVENGRKAVLTYTFDDVVATLNQVQSYDWAAFLRARLDNHAKEAPKDGLTRAGWKLVYTEDRNEATKNDEEDRHVTTYTYSLGIDIGKEGRVEYVAWDSPAFKQGLTIGTTLIAVNGRTYKSELLKEAITSAKSSHQPIELLVKKEDRYRTISIDYREGLKYPQLVRIEGTPDRLGAILAPLK